MKPSAGLTQQVPMEAHETISAQILCASARRILELAGEIYGLADPIGPLRDISALTAESTTRT